jgi:hypothetical protein
VSIVDVRPEGNRQASMKARGGLQDRWRLNIQTPFFWKGNWFAGGQEGLVDYWADDMIDLPILEQVPNIK